MSDGVKEKLDVPNLINFVDINDGFVDFLFAHYHFCCFYKCMSVINVGKATLTCKKSILWNFE